MNKKFSAWLFFSILVLAGSVIAIAQTSNRTGTASPLPQRFTRVLVGNIDNRLPIQIELSRSGDNVYGRYFYEKKRDGKYLSLSGKIDSTGTITLSESESEKQTGSFTGKLTNEIIDGVSTLKFRGSWTSATETKTLPVELVEQRFDLGGLKLVANEQSEAVKDQKFSIKSSFPQLDGAGDQRVANFNKAMADFIAENARKFKGDFKPGQASADSASRGSTMDISYKVMYADKNLISILYNVYTYTGGAHGNSGSAAFNYDLNRGRVLTLSDLFTPNANFIKTISDHCVNVLKQRKVSDDDWVSKGAGANRSNYPNWNIVPQGLLITFDPYQVAPYAAGPQEVVIPYSVLKGMIRTDGPLAGFAK